MLIDFGWSCQLDVPYADIDIIQLIRTIPMLKTTAKVRKYLYDNILVLMDQHCRILKSNGFPKTCLFTVAQRGLIQKLFDECNTEVARNRIRVTELDKIFIKGARMIANVS